VMRVARFALFVLSPVESVSQCVQSRECHAEQREASRIFRMSRRRDSSAEFILSVSKGLRMTLRHSLVWGEREG